MSKAIKNIAPNANIQSNTTPPRSGAFEVNIDNKLVFSKFEKGSFPTDPDIQSWF